MSVKNTVSPGQELHGFTIESVTPMPEFDSAGILAVHDKTGCPVFHIANNDRENSFCYAFQTPPKDSTGVAHILEHSVLCGSKNFPLKEPFITLAKGSMNTFLNAMTYPDRTVYPASSINEADYFNIMRVYGDAVFFPLLKEIVFMQEGHRLDFTESGNIESPLEVKGVVFNEMKGNYSNQRSIVGDWASRSLHDQGPYHHDSGGDPREIINLTYDAFKKFHSRYYHPSNCRILLYGNISTGVQLEFLDNHFLSKFDRLDVKSGIPLTPKREKPVIMHIEAPSDFQSAHASGDEGSKEGAEEKPKSEILINWLLDENTSGLMPQVWYVLEEILLGNAGSPLRRALVESKIGDDLSSIHGMEGDLKQAAFTVGLRGVKGDRSAEVEKLVFETLGKLEREGIPKESIDAAVSRVEFHTRDYTAGRLPVGLSHILMLISGWFNNAKVEELARLIKQFERIKVAYAKNPNLFSELIKKDLLENTHRSTLVVTPVASFMRSFAKPIDDYTAKAGGRMTGADRRSLAKKLEELALYQEKQDSEEDLAKIPRLSRKDLPREAEIIAREQAKTANGIPVLFVPNVTLGIAYVDIAFDTACLPAEFVPFVPLLAAAVTGSGLPGSHYADVQREISRLTGAFSYEYIANSPSKNGTTGEPASYLVFRTKMLALNAVEGLALVRRCIREADLSDTGRLFDILMEKRNGMAASIVPRGSSVALIRGAARLSPAIRRSEEWTGASQFLFLDALAKRNGNDRVAAAAKLSGKLRQVREFVLNKCSASLHVSCDKADWPLLQENTEIFASGFPATAMQSEMEKTSTDPGSPEALTVPTSVGFVACAMKGAIFGTKQYAAEVVMNNILSTGFLWENVRMKGGAYGASSSSFLGEGVFAFSSYRDPRLVETIAEFKNALAHAASGKITAEDVDRALVGVIGDAESPLRPGEKGFTQFRRNLVGIDDAVRQNHREMLLGLKPADIASHAINLLAAFESRVTTVVASEEAISKAEASGPGLKFMRTRLPV